MKILQITALYPPHIGGIENHAHQLSRNLVQRGHDVTVYTSNIPKTKKYEVIDGVKIHRFNSIGSPFNNQIVPEMFIKLLNNADFEVIHAHGHLQLTTNFAAISSLKNKIPLIITSHGTVQYKNWREYVNLIYNRTLGKWTLLQSDRIIALSPSQANYLQKFGVKNTEIIPNGTNLISSGLNFNSDEFRTEFSLKDETIILYVGGLIPRKGINYLIDAMTDVKSNSVLFIVGDVLQGHSDYKEKLLTQIKEKNIKNIIFTGNIDDDKLKETYLAADIFVLPSLSEGLPTVLLEAMAYNKATVATNIPGNSDLITNNENGILVQPENPDEIAKAINLLIDDPHKRETFGQNACEKIDLMYSWDKISDDIEKVYNNIVK